MSLGLFVFGPRSVNFCYRPSLAKADVHSTQTNLAKPDIQRQPTKTNFLFGQSPREVIQAEQCVCRRVQGDTATLLY